jgi:nucleoside-diphosphate-sugar epimerase
MKSYLVLGGEGFIGKYLVNFLKKNGAKVNSIDIKNGTHHDLRIIKLLDLDDYDYCFFLAWDVGGSKYLNQVSTWNSQFQNNILLTSNIIPQLQTSRIPFLFVSSQLAGTDHSPYSLSKLYAENYCRTIPTCGIARQWNAYGSPEVMGEKSHVISDLIYQAVFKGEIRLLTDGSELRKFVHLADICEAYMQIIKKAKGQVFDVSAGEYISILEISEIISEITGVKIIKANKKGYSPNLPEINQLPKWQPKIDLKEGIYKLVESYKMKNQNNK